MTKDTFHIIPSPNPDDSIKLLEQFNDVNIYGFFLNPDPNHPLSKVLQNYWTQIHYLTGDKVMIAATDVPKEWSDNLKNYWKEKIGDNFEEVWQAWSIKPDPGAAFQYMNIFNSPLNQSQLPCLVLFTDIENIENTQVVVRSLPQWDEESLHELLQVLLGMTRQCAEIQDKQKRLDSLNNLLTSPGAIILDHGKHVADKTIDYLKQNPAQILYITLSITLALTTGGTSILSLSPAVIAMLTVIRDAVKRNGDK